MYKEITVKSQKEFNDVPDDFEGRIFIEFGTWLNKAIVNRKFKHAIVTAWENATVEAWENATVTAWGNATVEAWGNATVEAWGNATVEAWGNATVTARENATVEAWGNATVEAWENAIVTAWGNATVTARGNAQIVDCLNGGKIQISGNARKVHNPKTIDEYISFYGLKRTKTRARFYKAVHKKEGTYTSDRDHSFIYEIGEKVKADGLTEDITEDCGQGIHMSYLQWALDYGRNWNDLAILELSAKVDDVILPLNCGKVRALEAKVEREVPLEECGVYGKIIVKRMKRG